MSIQAFSVDTSALIYRIATAPKDAWLNASEYFQSRALLREENARLSQENLIIKGQTQRLAAVLAENAHYRALLNSADIVEHDVMVAEVIAVITDPARHILVLDKGSADGVVKGQALLGADGLMGQITHLGNTTSHAILITDSAHAVPVQDSRSEVRGLAEGTGEIDRLLIRHIATTTDISIGDILVTSGLGGRFPPGYPVAKVTSIDLEPGAAFSTVSALPLAQLDRGRYVMLSMAAAKSTEPEINKTTNVEFESTPIDNTDDRNTKLP